MEEKQLTSRELEEQANALLAETDFEEIKLPKKAKKAAAAKKAEQENEQAEKPAEKFPPLDEKLVASLPAAALLQSNEKLMDIFAKGKAKGKLSSNDLMETIDEMNLESEQLDQIYDSLETLGVDIGTAEAIDSSIDDVEPPMEEIAGIEEEELVDPNELVDSFSTDDPVRMYLKEIGKVSLLSADEEISLATAMSEGMEAKEKLEEAEKNGTELSAEELKALKTAVKKGERSKQRLAEANLRLVVSIAKRYVGRGMLFLDLIQEGNVGLMRAVNKFDPDKGIKFSYYAAFWIRAYILKFIMDNWRMVKIGTTQAQRKLFYNLNRERQKLIAEGFDPDAATLAERLGVGEDQIVEMQQRLDASDMSLDATVGDESGSATRMDFLPALGPGIEESLAGMEIAELLQSKIRDILPSLSEKEAYILEHRLLTDDPVTLREIGERYNVTRERVRQLEARLLQKLKTHLSTDIQDFSEDWISH